MGHALELGRVKFDEKMTVRKAIDFTRQFRCRELSKDRWKNI